MVRRSALFAALIAAAPLFALFAFGCASPAFADLLITVDKTTQQMTVEKDGEALFTWPVSTGAAGYDTPAGSFKPFRMEKDHFSREWDDAPMPHSIFFTMKGHAIHGSTHKSIGRPASHGCVRLEPKNAALLFGLVKQETMAKTRIVLTGEAPTAPQVAKANQATANAARRNGVSRPAPGFEQSFSTDDVTTSVPPPRRERVLRGLGEVSEGDVVYYYDEDGRRRRFVVPRMVEPRYVEPRYVEPRYVVPRRDGYEVPPPPPPGLYYEYRR